MIQKIPSVKYVLDTDMSWRIVTPMNETMDDFGGKDSELQPLNKMLPIPAQGLVCSLRHEIIVTTMEDYVHGGAA